MRLFAIIRFILKTVHKTWKFSRGPIYKFVTNATTLFEAFAVYYGLYWFWGAMGSKTRHDPGTHGAYSLPEETVFNRTSAHLSLWNAKPTNYFIAGWWLTRFTYGFMNIFIHSFISLFIHSFIPYIFIGFLLCARCWAGLDTEIC